MPRPADPSGLATWSSALSQGTVSPAQVAAAIMSSAEYRSDLIAGWYGSELGRAPSAEETAARASVLGSSESQETVLAAIVGSPECYAHAAGTPTTFLTAAGCVAAIIRLAECFARLGQ